MLLPACISVMASILSAVLRTVTLFLLEMARIAPMSRRRAKCIVSIAGVGRGCRSASHRWDRADTKKAKLQTVLHAEVFFDPQAHTHRGVRFAAVIEGVDEALRDAENRLGPSSKLILCSRVTWMLKMPWRSSIRRSPTRTAS